MSRGFYIIPTFWRKLANGLTGRVFITICCSAGLVIGARWLIDPTIDSDTQSRSAELRNYFLAFAAIGGVPFLVLSHIVKSRDLLIKTESEILKNLIEQIKYDADQLSKIPRMVGDFPSEERQHANFYDVLINMKEQPSSGVKVELLSSIRRDHRSWEKLERACKSLDSVLSVASKFRNHDFNELIAYKLVAQIGEANLTVLTAVSVIMSHFDGKNSTLHFRVFALGNRGILSDGATRNINDIWEVVQETIEFEKGRDSLEHELNG